VPRRSRARPFPPDEAATCYRDGPASPQLRPPSYDLPTDLLLAVVC
jgi:hypothetical protein